MNTEFLGDDRAIFRVGVFRSMAFHCKILNMPDILTKRRGVNNFKYIIKQGFIYKSLNKI
jgi:hypothetical protein